MEISGKKRLILGVFVLLLVDFIWVGSSELSRFIFNDSGYNKPFFSTYLKTSMFSLYLLGFLFRKSWRHQCLAREESFYQVVDTNTEDELNHETCSLSEEEGAYQSYKSIFTLDQLAPHLALENDNTATLTSLILWRYLGPHSEKKPEESHVREDNLICRCGFPLVHDQRVNSKGEASYEPLNLGDQEKSSDSDDSSVKSVRFSRMTEVRHLSETEAMEAMLSRLSFSASLRAEQFVKDTANKFPIRKVMKISLIFCLLWFVGNYGYQEALSDTEVGVVNVVSSTSGLFTLILAAMFPSCNADRFTLSKFAAVLFMVGGTVLISIEDIKLENSSIPVGVIWALIGAVLYACYMVFLRRKVPSEDKMDFTMFFGFVGLFNALILWPGFFILNATGWETFQVPSKDQLLYMVVNGLVGTVLSELLWLWGCFLTSSLMATLSITLTIPLTMLCDIFLKSISYSWRFYVGSVPILASFVAVTLLTHFEDWDPLLDGVKAISRLCLGRNRDYRLVAMDCNEQERLIACPKNDTICGESISNNEINTSFLNHTNHV